MDEFAKAREELAKCPEGAALTELVLGATLHRLRLDLEYAKLRYEAGLKGGKAPREKRTADRDARIRARAATMEGTDSAKAKYLARDFDLSERTIRRILRK